MVRYKIKYVKHYVERWALIQAERSTINKINFVDCMCNAGIYKDGDFCTALEVISAFNVLAEKPDYQAKEFVVYLNDISADRIETFVGQYGAFDRMAARAVINAKRHYPNITLSILLPYHPSKRSVNAPDGYDDTFYPPDMEKVPRKLAIVRANKYMVDSSDFLIDYVWHPASNARNLLEYAQARERKGLIRIENLAASNPHSTF